MNHELTSRNFLINLREQAIDLSKRILIDEQWKRAYENLADALDKLDAMQARTQIETLKNK